MNGVEVAAKVYRGDAVEAIHYGSVAVVNGDGDLTHYLGDPEMMIMSRSSIKMFQLMPLLQSGACEKYTFSDKQLAVMCGSHDGSDEHSEVVLSNLQAAENNSENLQCGTHWPLGMSDALQFPLNNEHKDPLRNNCSGKHSGFLALAKFLGEEVSSYLDPNSKIQQMIKQTVADYVEFPSEKMEVGIDGCSAPNYSLPLKNLALGFMKFSSGQKSEQVDSEIVNRIRKAIYDYPKMLSGEHRLDYDLMRSYPQNIICKIGAESLEGIGFTEPKIGIAVKIHDGNFRALGAVCVEVLRQLGLVDKIDNFPYLKGHREPKVRNHRQLITGRISADFVLKKV